MSNQTSKPLIVNSEDQDIIFGCNSPDANHAREPNATCQHTQEGQLNAKRIVLGASTTTIEY